jgi:hypothetical protein
MLKTELREIEVSRTRLRALKELEGRVAVVYARQGHAVEDDDVRLMPEV